MESLSNHYLSLTARKVRSIIIRKPVTNNEVAGSK